jgi:hypothetical protein
LKKLTFLLLSLLPAGLFAQDTIAINPSTQYQTIEGWGHGGGILSMLSYGADTTYLNPMNRQTLDFLIDDLGLTGSRTWEVGPRIDGTGTDDGNCDSINWNKFQVGPLDTRIAAFAVYFRNRIVAQGFQPSFYSSPGYPTHATDQKPWIMLHPGERAQQIWASALWWKNNYGININYDVIYNEPSGPVTAAVIADDIKALGPRMQAKGLATLTQYAEAVAPLTDWQNYIVPVQNDTALWPYVGRLSYHNYGTADPYRSQIRDFGKAKGIRTGQTEMGDPSYDDLYADLTLGGVSYWEVAYSGSNTLVPIAGNTGFTPEARYYRKRQLMHYVRPGAVRIGASTNDSTVRVVAFSKGGQVTTVIENIGSAAKTVNLSGLPPGKYGLSSSAGAPFQEFGIQTVPANGKITLSNVAAGSAATTLYPYSGVNLPPNILSWTCNPGYVVAPATTATLTATANDPELDALTYSWSVAKQPGGAAAILASPNAASTGVSGLTIAGNYIFNIDVKDATHTSSRQVYLIVYSSNPLPVLWQPGFRIAAPYGLVFAAPGASLTDTTHAIIELPTSAVTLQVGISDLANSDFTGRGTWSLVKQPAGASVSISATTYIYISIRANVTGMTVPGDYIFRVNVTVPGQPDLTTVVMCTVHPASSGPVVNSITATPQTVVLPANTSHLLAVTSDPQAQLLRHWWLVKSAPAGARPVFSKQGSAISDVSGLTIPGTYVFTLRAFDDIHMSTQDITVIVTGATGIATLVSSVNDAVKLYPNPAKDLFTIETASSEKELIQLFDVTGKLMLTQTLQNGKGTLDAGTLAPGVYTLSLTSDRGRINKRLMIVR